ncbi:hypothetical protein E1264_05535 [Actinomadura sp. KC216]|uniref:AfsR/SARP family transcriptional regulator n=1 Tax=Actinomadura sp. KC216 TaxID=2530370 RepID=UPI001044BBB1|nr:hypothetical protein [Actinomadura sp. KC216]TDB90343.1 hypothetical protein E1264_05535 [Actinomadura sp. KC216]
MSSGLSSTNDPALNILEIFSLRVGGQEIEIPAIPRSLLSHVAVNGRTIDRRRLTQILWPGLGAAAATKRLRQILWRLRSATEVPLLEVNDLTISLLPNVRVDWETAEAEARAVVSSGAIRADSPGAPVWRLFALPLMSDHDCDCATGRAAQLQWDHLRFTALQIVAEEMMAAGEAMPAVEHATAGIRVDEFSEWPYRIIAQAHQERGDLGLAAKVMERYDDLQRARRRFSAATGHRFQPARPNRVPAARRAPVAEKD